jgi:RloB-like protein
MPRRNRAKDLRRRTGVKAERRTIVVFCEGEASEPDYPSGSRRLPGIHDSTAIRVEIDPDRGVPLTLVKRAIERSTDVEVDQCWCVFDVEWPQHHPNLLQAVELARSHGIGLAVSNPCFELWLILHLREQSGFLTTADAERRSRRLDGRAGKRIDPDRYLPHRHTAAQRASRWASATAVMARGSRRPPTATRWREVRSSSRTRSCSPNPRSYR